MDTDRIFNTLEKLGIISQLKDQYRKKSEQIRGCEAKTCGNCHHWMKINCKPEKEKKKFTSVDTMACRDFKIDPWKIKMLEELRVELKKIEGNLVRFYG